ncbi:TonB-dependent receptor [Arundinibacter roseus]|uniref:TonB-dependent receptor n=1 Tax=Arundinibacter roseus TaxID=2070510 RepID=A0A4R4KG54_9BACT|nr:TonB-dependent receptor [Arundinibacter roseus]TDB65826.1 TonB-dependent receptor [Arundinibacter roseus]
MNLRMIRMLLFLVAFCLPQFSWANAVLRGKVIDEATQQPIQGVSVMILESKKGTITDQNGEYSITLPLGDYTIRFSAISHYNLARNIELTDNLTLNISMRPLVNNLDELQISGRRDDANVRSTEMSVVRLNIAALKKIPVVFGEVDIIRALMLQPGINSVGEGAGGFNVRGGRVDQNLVLLDGAPLFNTSHLLGFFSNLNPDVTQDATLYKGNIPARYGGRLSSALVLNSKSGNTDRWNVQGGVGTISSRVVVDGPLIGRKLTLMAGARVAYPGVIIKLFPDLFEGNKANFHDLNAKLTFQPNDRHRVTLSGYRSYDRFKFPADTLFGWQSGTLAMHWNTFLSDKLTTSVSLLQSTYNFQVDSPKQFTDFTLTSTIRQREANAGLVFSPTANHKLEVGTGYIQYRISPGNLAPQTSESSIRPLQIETEYGGEFSAHIQEEWTINSSLTLTAGLRYVQFKTLGPYTQYAYEAGVPTSPETVQDSVVFGDGQTVQTYGGWEPRLALKIGLGSRQSLKLSYNRSRQFLHLISNTTAMSPVDFWKLSDPFIPPQLSDQYAIGIFRNWADNSIETSVEGYYKDISNLVEYRNGAELLLNPYLETSLLSAFGKSYGVEFTVNKNKGRLTGSLNYTYSRALISTKTEFPGEAINEGEWYPSLFDRPHVANLTGGYNLGKGWTYSFNFTYSTGRPNTYPDGQYLINTLPVVNYSRRNADRLPDYHRLDMSFSYDTRRNREQTKYSVWVFSFYNFYGRKNPYSIYFTNYRSALRSYQLTVFGSIIPSLTWNFKF